MELITYVHSELVFEWANHGIPVEPPLNCYALTQLKQTTQNVALVGCAGVLAASLSVGGLVHAEVANTEAVNAAANTTVSTTATTTSGTTSSSTTQAAANVDHSDDVAAIQTLLTKRGFQPSAIDGIKGPQTEAAILRAQAFYKLSQDGIAGAQTLAALQRDTYEVIAETSAATTQDNASNTEQNSSKNKDNDKSTSDGKPTVPLTPAEINANQQIQGLLKDRGFYTGAIDGIPGPKTKAAIRQAQTTYNLTVDGVAGPLTVAALEKDQPVASPQQQPTVAQSNSQTTPEVTAAQTPSDTVTEAQRLMRELGFYQGAVDGIPGPATTTAVKRAQAFYGLTVDGVIGPSTLESLRA